MWRIAVALTIALVLLPAAGDAATARHYASNRLTIVVPAGWQPTERVFSSCSDPKQVLALSTGHRPVRDGALLLVLQDTVNPPTAFHARSRLALPRRPMRFEGCCGTPTAPGYSFGFRERGRDLTVYIWARDRALAEIALGALETLRLRAS